jgi:hypothetical protein
MRSKEGQRILPSKTLKRKVLSDRSFEVKKRMDASMLNVQMIPAQRASVVRC